MKPTSFSQWMKDESGAVTVDWTVLAAAVVGLGIASVAAVRSGTGALAGDISSSLTSASVVSLGTLGSGTSSGFVYSLLNITQSTFDGWVGGTSGYTSEQIQTYYDEYATSAAYYIEAGDASSAAYYIDAMAAYEQALTNRNVALSDSSVSVETMTGRYEEMG
jgi:hypothetical protein